MSTTAGQTDANRFNKKNANPQTSEKQRSYLRNADITKTYEEKNIDKSIKNCNIYLRITSIIYGEGEDGSLSN